MAPLRSPDPNCCASLSVEFFPDPRLPRPLRELGWYVPSAKSCWALASSSFFASSSFWMRSFSDCLVLLVSSAFFCSRTSMSPCSFSMRVCAASAFLSSGA